MSNLLEYSVSVTTLANFSCRVGDLEGASIVGPSAREGIKAHQKIQRAAIASGLENAVQIEAEVRLTCRVELDDCKVTLSGRLDLLDRQVCRLSEIKTTHVPAAQVPESQKILHWAQLYLYGYIYLSSAMSEEQHLELELLHINTRADTQEAERRVAGKAELEEFAKKALHRYVSWLRKVSHWQSVMSVSAGAMEFPHGSFRAGQRDMAIAIYRSSRDGQALMCEAPTGIGKTVSALFPAIKSMGEGSVEQVVYLTAKVAGRTGVLQVLQHMQVRGLAITAVQIRARQATCFCSNGRCDRDDNGRCPMTLGFFDRLPAARDELLACGIMTDTQLDDIAWQHQVCPFELALHLLPWVHVVVADYNYVFDPLVRLSSFSEPCSKTLLLIDEVHNLVERSRSMYSAELDRVTCMEQASICRQRHPQVANALDKLICQLMRHARKSFDEVGHKESERTPAREVVHVSEKLNSSIARSASEVIEAMVATMGQAPTLPETCIDLFRNLCRLVVIAELFAEHHRSITTMQTSARRKQVKVNLFCLDASSALMRQYRQFRATVVFSATLRPAMFYKDTLGLPESTAFMQLSSPFDSVRANHCIVDWIDTRYRSRESSMPALVSLIHAVSAGKPGNYLVFFPSYAYLEQVHAAYCSLHPEVEVWSQTSHQTRAQQHELLARLEKPGLRIGFAILGGVFGEGIDYVGERLIGVIVVSPGLPGLDTRSQLLSTHFQEQGHDGFDFVYRYPGFTRVLQTVGRLVRDEADSGVVVLVDQRFNQGFYKSLFPQHWQLKYPRSEDELMETLELFWRNLP